ncbi:MAG: cytochrome c nitrite reductase small subunit [Candidatus Omnitrophica bacterium]|nr:cytochrome c nitrite reductase small subunit [Candidatus Omnitrophota bacterium]
MTLRMTHTTGWVLSIMVGVFLGLGLFTFSYGEGLSYFSKDPNACTNCHIMQPQFDSWQKASHHGVATCVDCHLPHETIPKLMSKADNGFWHSKGFTFQDFHEPIFIRESNMRILQKNCLHCNKDFVHDILPNAQDSIKDFSCVHCHRSAGHGETIGLGKYEPVHKLNHEERYQNEPK